ILKGRYVYCFGAARDDIIHEWTAFNCLYSEISDAARQKVYLLSNGHWYEVEQEFAKRVNSDYQELTTTDDEIDLPDYNHKDEHAYNVAAAAGDDSLCCMDAINIP